MEQDYYRQGAVWITSTLATFGATSYPLRGITAVSTGKIPAPYAYGVLALLLAAPFGMCGYSNVGESATGDVGLLGVIMCLVLIITAVAVFIFAKPKYTLVLATSGQQVQAYVTKNLDEVAAISGSLKRAISELR
jgi:hypothetical protein